MKKMLSISAIVLIVFYSQVQDIGGLNVAKGRPTGSYSKPYGTTWKPNLAVDGHYGRLAGLANSCFITQKAVGKVPSWWIDLQDEFFVTHIKIFPRSDCCGDQFQGVTIKIGSSISDATVCAQYTGPRSALGDVLDIQCNKRGSFVYMESPAAQYFSLCEVEIHSNITEIGALNVAKGKPTGTEGAVYGAGWGTSLAVDGDYQSVAGPANTCFIGQKATGKVLSWWVDLQDEFDIAYLRVFTRNDCCSDQFQGVTIKIGSSVSAATTCAQYTGPPTPGDVLKIQCSGRGRFIYMEALSAVYFSLCEVEVFTAVDEGEEAADYCM